MTAYNDPAPSPWMTKKQVAEYLSMNQRTVDRRRVPWTPDRPEAGLIRYRNIACVGGKTIPRFWREDVQSNVFKPIPQSRPNAQRL